MRAWRQPTSAAAVRQQELARLPHPRPHHQLGNRETCGKTGASTNDPKRMARHSCSTSPGNGILASQPE
jgi:hypothetical protein